MFALSANLEVFAPDTARLMWQAFREGFANTRRWLEAATQALVDEGET